MRLALWEKDQLSIRLEFSQQTVVIIVWIPGWGHFIMVVLNLKSQSLGDINKMTRERYAVACQGYDFINKTTGN